MTFTLRKLVCLGFYLVICVSICVSTHAQQSAKPRPSPAPVDEDGESRAYYDLGIHEIKIGPQKAQKAQKKS